MTEEELVAAELLDRESITELIERRMARRLPYFPVVTVSREPGSGGRPIGAALAKRMGFRFYDEELVEMVARRLKIPKAVLERVDEKSRSTITDLVQNIFNPDYVSDETFFRNVCQVILDLAKKGGAVIMGRGSNFLVPQAYSLRVRIVAPYRVRVARAVEYEHVSRDKAREIIRDVTADQSQYVKQYFGKNIAAGKYYDAVINTTFFSIDQSVELIMKMYQMKFPSIKLAKALLA